PPKGLRITNATFNDFIYGVEGKELTLQCKVEQGLPRANLMWIHNGKKLNQSKNGVLNYTFKPKTRDHQSPYTCRIYSRALIEAL
ncbi:Hypothetical predicted protein, partial [Mytilus galloprovincialis]